MTEPTPTPTPTPAPGGSVQVSLAPAAPPATPDPTPPADPAAPPDDAQPDDSEFVSDRQKRRFAALSGRVTQTMRERDQARIRVEQLLEREVLRVAATTLAVPSDVFLEGATVADLLDETGADVDPAKVNAAVAAIAAKRPGLLASTAPRPLSHGIRTAERKPNFAEAIQDMTRGRI